MFSAFLSRFPFAKRVAENERVDSVFSLGNWPKHVNGFEYFFQHYSGMSFGTGIYRAHAVERLEHWNEIVVKAFPNYRGRIQCFGYDWLGRQFALDFQRKSGGGEPLILMMEPGTAQVLEIPVTFLAFHNDEMVNYADAVLAQTFFDEWRSANSQKQLGHAECAGYRVPLFLGGEDVLSNIEIIDLEMYWVITGQLINKMKSLPPGTVIGKIDIE